MASKAVLFDLDGTILDSSNRFALFLGFLCQKYKKSSVIKVGTRYYDVSQFEDLKAIFPEPHRKIYEMLSFDLSREKHLLDFEHEDYMREHVPNLISGIDDTITKLIAKGYKIGIASSNSREIIEKRLSYHGILSKFGVIVCEEDVKNPKPHPEPIIKCLSILDAQREQTSFVGDLPMDIKAGKAAGVTTIGIDWGLGTYDSLARENPDYIAKSVPELERILNL